MIAQPKGRISVPGLSKGADTETRGCMLRHKHGPRHEAGGNSSLVWLCPEGDEGGAMQAAEDLLLERLGFWSCFLRADLAGEPTAMTGYKARKLSHGAQDSVTPGSEVEMAGEGGWE